MLRGAPEPGQAEMDSLEKVVELRTCTGWEVPQIHWKSIPGCWTNHRKGRVCIVAERANGITKLSWTVEDRSVRRPAQEERGW